MLRSTNCGAVAITTAHYNTHTHTYTYHHNGIFCLKRSSSFWFGLFLGVFYYLGGLLAFLNLCCGCRESWYGSRYPAACWCRCMILMMEKVTCTTSGGGSIWPHSSNVESCGNRSKRTRGGRKRRHARQSTKNLKVGLVVSNPFFLTSPLLL